MTTGKLLSRPQAFTPVATHLNSNYAIMIILTVVMIMLLIIVIMMIIVLIMNPMDSVEIV